MSYARRLAILILIAAGLPQPGAGQETKEPSREVPRGHGEKNFLRLFTLEEVHLTGIAKTPTGYIAVLETAERRTFFAKVGDQLYDAKILAIGESSVTVEHCPELACGETPAKKRRPVKRVLRVRVQEDRPESKTH